MAKSRLHVRRDVAERFLHALGDAPHVFQTFHEVRKVGKDPDAFKWARKRGWSLDECFGELANLNLDAAEPTGIFVTVNRTDGSVNDKGRPNRSHDSIARVRAVFVEFDANDIEPAEDVLDALPRSMVVQSKNGRHHYWLLEESEDVAKWRNVVAAMIRKLGSDPACKDPNRVLRIPGFYHRKDPDDPFMVELVRCDPARRYTLDQVIEAFCLDLRAPAKATVAPAPEIHAYDLDAKERRVRGYLDNVAPAVEGSGGWAQTKVACTYGWDFGLSEAEYFPLLLEWNARCVPPWDRDILWDKLQAVYRAVEASSDKHFGWKLEEVTPEWEEKERRRKAWEAREADEEAQWAASMQWVDEHVPEHEIREPPGPGHAEPDMWVRAPDEPLAVAEDPQRVSPYDTPLAKGLQVVETSAGRTTLEDYDGRISFEDWSQQPPEVDEAVGGDGDIEQWGRGWGPPSPSEPGHREERPDPNVYRDGEDSDKTVFNGPDGLPMTDHGNGQRFHRMFGSKCRYVSTWGGSQGYNKGWVVWDGTRWRRDVDGEETDEDFEAAGVSSELAKVVSRDMMTISAQIPDKVERKAWKAWCRSTDSVKGTRNMLVSASTIRGIATSPAKFDRDDDLLNTWQCTVDLRSGQLINHQRDHYITKITNVSPADVPCPLWLAFLDKIMLGDQEMVAFLQRAFGYSLTGETGQQCLFSLWGTGKNGKSTLLGVLRKLAGAYCRNTDFTSFEEKGKTGDTRNDLVRLNRARVVTAVEPNRDRRLDEGVIKRITGGDEPITARFLYGEFFDFYPRFKLWLSSNHKIEIRGADEGIWRRIMMIPFQYFFPEEERDLNFPKKLDAELPGIMYWAIEGAKIWYRDGLMPPEKVLRANEEYRSEMDNLGSFLNDCVIFDPGSEGIHAKDLFERYREWCRENGETKDLSHREFGIRMGDRQGIRRKRKNSGMVYLGMRLVDPLDAHLDAKEDGRKG